MFSVKDKYRPQVTMAVGVLGVILAIMGLADALNTYITILGAVVAAHHGHSHLRLLGVRARERRRTGPLAAA